MCMKVQRSLWGIKTLQGWSKSRQNISFQPRNSLLHLLTVVYILYTMNSLTIADKERSRVEKTKSYQTIMFNMRGSRESRLESLPMAGPLYKHPGWRAIHKMKMLKLCRFLQGVPLWMMGSLGGRRWCLSINWINGQWRLAFLALQRQELTAWEQKN